eukprot:gene6927-14066_t
MSSESRNGMMVYIIGIAGIILCWSPHFLHLSHELTYNPETSPIYESMKSAEFVNFLMISLGLCIPMFLEYVFDLITFGFNKDTHLGYLSRLLLLSSLLLPDIFLLLYIIPNERVELWGTVTAIRTMLCVCVSFGHIWQNGVNCRTELILSVCGFILRSYVSVIDLGYVELLQMFILVITAILIFILNIRWFRSIRDIKLEDLTTKQLSSTIYLVSLVLISIALIVVRACYGPMNSQSTVQNLVAYKVLQAMFVMFVFLAHSRILRKEMIQTQARQSNIKLQFITDIVTADLLQSFINVGRSQFHMLTGGATSVGIDTHKIRIDVKDTGYVSKSLMTLHEGSISAVSEGIGHGCTFTIELPVFLSTDDMVLDSSLSDQRLLTEMKIWNDISVEMMSSSSPIAHQHSGESTYSFTSLGGRESIILAAELSSRASYNLLPVLLMVDDSTMSRKMIKRLVYDQFSLIYEADDEIPPKTGIMFLSITTFIHKSMSKTIATDPDTPYLISFGRAEK